MKARAFVAMLLAVFAADVTPSNASPLNVFSAGPRLIKLSAGSMLPQCIAGQVCLPRVAGGASTVVVGPPVLPATATRAVRPGECPGQNLGAVCGTVDVPLDRNDPNGRQLPIFFELFTHVNPGPPVSAILVNGGGPGGGTTDAFDTYVALQLFGADLDVHDLLLVDDRGRGFSGTIDCKPLQHGLEPFLKSVADCASQLGPRASLYGTGDIALDVDAVRAALGYELVDFYGASYGGADVTAYATRFGSHLRSIVLDAPTGAPNRFVIPEMSREAHSETRMVALACGRSPTCGAEHPEPAAEYKRLVDEIAAHPIAGQAHDASGNTLNVRVDEATLLAYITHNPTGRFVGTGEILAAGASMRRGDNAPLLRLEAESQFSFRTNYGNPTVFSVGAQGATGCADFRVPWRWSDSPSRRLEEWEEAIRDLPTDYFAPFSKSAATALSYAEAIACTDWELPTPANPIVEPGAKYPDTPTLVLDGDMDDNVPFGDVLRVVPLFPNSTFVPVAGSGHVTVGWSACAAELTARFIETTTPGDTSCASTPQLIFPAVGRFALLAKDAVPAEIDPAGRNRVDLQERKAVTVAVAAAIDALQRSTIGSGRDFCLRSGSFKTSYGSAQWESHLAGCAFAQDVAVTGRVSWESSYSFDADLALSGAGTAGGRIHVSGTWEAPGPVGFFHISGELGGLEVSLLVPNA
jgi:pimeloyl-ACP methyl ester carboxylesterase